MNFKEYVDFTDTTAVYPNPDTDIAYPMLGLVDELEEYKQAKTKEDIIKELGDVLYYVARVSKALNLKVTLDADELVKYKTMYQTDEPEDYIHFNNLNLSTITGYLAGRCKKYIRGDYNLEDLQPLANKAVMSILRQLYEVAEEKGSSMQEIMQINVEKLSSRKERGVLKGNGDNR